MKYTFGVSYDSCGIKLSNYVEFELELTEKEVETIISFLKENGDCDYGYLEPIDSSLFWKINDAGNDAVLKSINEDRGEEEQLDFFDVDWTSMFFEFSWPDSLLDAAGLNN